MYSLHLEQIDTNTYYIPLLKSIVRDGGGRKTRSQIEEETANANQARRTRERLSSGWAHLFPAHSCVSVWLVVQHILNHPTMLTGSFPDSFLFVIGDKKGNNSRFHSFFFFLLFLVFFTFFSFSSFPISLPSLDVNCSQNGPICVRGNGGGGERRGGGL